MSQTSNYVLIVVKVLTGCGDVIDTYVTTAASEVAMSTKWVAVG